MIKLVLVLAAWLATAFALAATGVMARAPFLVPAFIVLGVAVPVLAYRRSTAMRALVDALPPRLPILLQTTRAAFGALFLVELAAGTLPDYFAERAGVGDLVVGILAPLAALAWPARTRLRRAASVAFHVLGLADLAIVVASAQIGLLAWHDPLLQAALPRLPYSLLPTFVVPLLVLAHLTSLRRLRAANMTNSAVTHDQRQSPAHSI